MSAPAGQVESRGGAKAKTNQDSECYAVCREPYFTPTPCAHSPAHVALCDRSSARATLFPQIPVPARTPSSTRLLAHDISLLAACELRGCPCSSLSSFLASPISRWLSQLRHDMLDARVLFEAID